MNRRYINRDDKMGDVDVQRAYRYRLYPDSKRQKEIDEQMELARLLYNKLLEKAKDEYQKTKSFAIKKATFNKLLKDAIAENKDYKRLYSQTRQNVFIRLQRAYQNFFRRAKERKSGKRVKAGFPRFKAKGRYRSLTYPQFGFFLDKNMLRMAKIGGVKIELHRPIEGTIKTLTIKKEAGKYYAIFSTTSEMEPPKVKDTNPVGIDMGLETFATFSDGTKIKKPNFINKNEKHIAHWQRIVARRQKGSRNRDKAKLKLERKWQESNNRINDFIQKTTTELVEGKYTSFAVEGLRIQNMLKNHRLARSIQSASWSRFIQVLSYKAEEAGLGVTVVDARNTSQICSECGSLNSLALSDRAFDCRVCGYHEDRDVNAARNILNRATAGHAGSHACGDLTPTIQQESQVESLKQEHTPQRTSTDVIVEEAHGL
jgi:putative transposase